MLEAAELRLFLHHSLHSQATAETETLRRETDLYGLEKQILLHLPSQLIH